MTIYLTAYNYYVRTMPMFSLTPNERWRHTAYLADDNKIRTGQTTTQQQDRERSPAIPGNIGFSPSSRSATRREDLSSPKIKQIPNNVGSSAADANGWREPVSSAWRHYRLFFLLVCSFVQSCDTGCRRLTTRELVTGSARTVIVTAVR